MSLSTDTFKLLVYGRHGQQTAQIIATYLNEQFVMLKRYPATVELTKGKDDNPIFDSWDICLPTDAREYTTTLQEIRSSAGDFWNGYSQALTSKET